jgi:hypothetical protein
VEELRKLAEQHASTRVAAARLGRTIAAIQTKVSLEGLSLDSRPLATGRVKHRKKAGEAENTSGSSSMDKSNNK